MRRIREKKPYYNSLLANSVSASRLTSPVKSPCNVSRSAPRSPVNILRFGCPSDIIVHVPILNCRPVARLKLSAQRNLSKVQCTLQDLLDKEQPPPKRAELKDKEKVIQELNSIRIPMQSFKEVTPNRRVFSLAVETEKSSEELRSAILKRLQAPKGPGRDKPIRVTPFAFQAVIDPDEAEAALAPYRLNPVRPYRGRGAFAFFTAIKEQNLKVIRALIADNKTLVNEQDSLGLAPMHWAVKREDIPLVEMLLSWGANPNAVDMLNRTPLYLASKQNNVKLANLLISRGADPTIRAVNGISPEQIAKEGSPLWVALSRHEQPTG